MIAQELPEWTGQVFFGRLDNWHVSKRDRKEYTQELPCADLVSGILTDTDAKAACRNVAARAADPLRVATDEERATWDREKRTAKGCCPFWAISGLWVSDEATPRNYVQLDFDGMAADDAPRARDIIAGLGCVLLASVSVSGRGVFCVIDTPCDTPCDKAGRDKLRAELRAKCLLPVSDILKAEGIAHVPDDSTLDVGHGRVEPFDPDVYVSPDYVRFDCDVIARKAREARRKADYEAQRQARWGFYSHPISQIAESFRRGATVGGIATAAAMAFVGAHVNVFSQLEGTGTCRAARAFVVALGRSGGGKTTIMDAIESARAKAPCPVGYRKAKPRSDAALAEVLKRAGTRIVETGDGTKKAKVRVAIDESESPRNTLFLLDEGGKFLSASARNEKCGDMDSALCEAFGAYFTPPLTKSGMDDEEIDRVQANATLFVCATPKQWIEYAATECEENGMGRRRLVFADTDTGEETETAATLYDVIQAQGDTDVFMPQVQAAADRLAKIPLKQTFCVTNEALKATGAAMSALREAGITSPEYHVTLIVNYATLCAAARVALTGCTDYAVTPADMYAVGDILAESVCKARGIIAERVEMASNRRHKSDGEVWSDIRDYLRDGKRRDKAEAWLNRKPPVYRDMWGKMRAKGEIVETKGGEAKRGHILRIATDEERAAWDEEHETAAKAAQESVWDGNTTAAPKRPTASQTSKTPQERCEAYVRKCTQNVGEGNDNYLRRLAGLIKSKDFYSADPQGCEAVFRRVVTSGRHDMHGHAPYTDRDAARLFRDGGLTQIAQ